MGKESSWPNRNPNYALEKTVPTIILGNDDHGGIERFLDDKDDVNLEFNIENKIFLEGKTSYNVEIAGSDKADEIVMLGGPRFIEPRDRRNR